jgi:uncharacterized protein YbjT (DUF2867 family)
MKILVVGASRGSGAAVVRELAARGHLVTAYARSAVPADVAALAGVSAVAGDVMDDDALAKAVVGQDAVVVTLGISDNPLGVRLLRRAGTPLDVRSAGTARVLAAMRGAGVDRVVVQSTYGVGETYRQLSASFKLVFSLLLRPQVRDSERQEAAVRSSATDWTLVRPVGLHDSPTVGPAVVTADDRVVGMKVGRDQVARAIADALTDDTTVGQVLSVSA